MANWLRLEKISLRVRLTGWYIILLGCTLAAFSSYLYLQLKYSLQSQVDRNLNITASEILNTLILDNEPPVLKKNNSSQKIASNLKQAGYAVRLITSTGKIVDGFGEYQEFPAPVPGQKGYSNFIYDSGIWRVYNQPIILSKGRGLLQVAQSLEPLKEASEHLLTLMLLSYPLILFLAGLGGLFLADRALRPIDNIIRTAQAINPDDITRRIGYAGSFDEVGRLAMTLDRMLDRLSAAFEHERRFTADASHELRTPLAVIKGRIGVTLSQNRTPEEYQATLQALEYEVDRLIRLANGLLFLTRLEQETIQFQQIDLSELLSILVEQFQMMAEPRNILLTDNIEPELMIAGNADYLTNVFLNLLDNAIKYTPDGGKVTVKAQPQAEQVYIRVSNSGKGIAPENLPHLFKRFYRVEADRSRHTGGTGLGLAIAYEIVRLHKGTITVESEVNQTTTFTVSLPLKV
ncbi:sensor histidine kinase [Gloeothece verrucosa]|uniref:histidine kinase n=1 Tax=Gloeothece verrucosa (strain PCC 7822) TaxID=497965 RepID=E0UHC5_GLOV7|nr:ATP-binding protein [Gloeothece verrucosa]ADN16839.1 integral membrane sensor signal transduction histidine kinase [Gloeothece verrucosa PCC 7822]